MIGPAGRLWWEGVLVGSQAPGTVGQAAAQGSAALGPFQEDGVRPQAQVVTGHAPVELVVLLLIFGNDRLLS